MPRMILDPETCYSYPEDRCPPDVLKRYEAHMARVEAERFGTPVITLGQARLIETTHITIVCKFCGSDNVTKYGFKEHVQQYWCKDCKRKFVANNALPGKQYPPEQVASAVSMFYEGLSLNAIRRQLDHDYKVRPSDSTVYDWIVEVTEQASAGLAGVRGDVGRTWVIDETVLQIDGENGWFWDIIAEETRFLLASHLTFSRNKQDAIAVLRRGVKITTKVPHTILSDGLKSYPDAIEQVFGAASKHIVSKGFSRQPNTNLIERFHGTLKQRVKVMRGMQNRETARLIMDGWLVHYNFFRPHETLGDKTPAQVAGIEFKWKNWREVVADGHIPTLKRETKVTDEFGNPVML